MGWASGRHPPVGGGGGTAEAASPFPSHPAAGEALRAEVWWFSPPGPLKPGPKAGGFRLLTSVGLRRALPDWPNPLLLQEHGMSCG